MNTRRGAKTRTGQAQENQFLCRHCRRPVFTLTEVSGVRSRNHCPYCLHSRHLDLFEAGDRLSACKGVMMPIGLTRKQTRKKYNPHSGELLLIHMCQECGKLAINRMARDDDAPLIYEHFLASWKLPDDLRCLLARQEIDLLGKADDTFVTQCLFGQGGFNQPDFWMPEQDVFNPVYTALMMQPDTGR
ncbi:MAG: RNHCP domain-containing protein [Anaerolineaceae bacterium]